MSEDLRPVSAADIAFLASLGRELATQDTCGNCDPRFWVVLDRVDVSCWEEEAEFWFIADDDGNEVGRTECEVDAGELSSIPGRTASKIAEDTLFLTLRECREHIERNRHNYERPMPFCQTAVRSPQFERLISILQGVDWGALAEEDDLR